ncbi:MAG: hypothetical protein J6Y89_09370 [Lachnospiraceae bacterium]|nr:hypothetical protein [Lachnospiraceae bacterium]
MANCFKGRMIRVLSGIAAAAFAVSGLAVSVNADSYSGITIDGDFSDWDSVVKYGCISASSHVNEAAMVWDGDWIYIYIDEEQQNSASWSSDHWNTNGQFNIKTDLGYVLVITFENNGAAGNIIEVTDVETGAVYNAANGGIKVAFNSEYSTWEAPTLTEIAIPSSLLPQYSSTINFGYYLGGNIITGVADCSGYIHVDPDDPTPTPDPDEPTPVPDPDDPTPTPEPDDPTPTPEPDDPTPTTAPYNDGSGIVIDGDYHDWDYYPVTTIQYDTAGMSNNYNDAEGSIYQRDGIAYVHCIANEFSKQDTGYKYGTEFLEVTVIFGYTHTKLIAIELGPDGSLDWSSSRARSMSEGTHHYALFYFSDAGLSSNINDISSLDHYLGDMYVTIEDHQDETEFWFDIAALAECGNIEPDESQSIFVHFHRVGWPMLETSGVSTGPVFVAVLSTVAAGSFITLNRRKKDK